MKQKSKTKTIIDAFTKVSNIDEEIFLARINTCNHCEYNSANTDTSNLNIVEKIRQSAISNPFCTACGCQIKEKASQETEECGLAEKGLTPKWNRVKLEITNDTNFNLINKSHEKVNVRLSKDKSYYILELGKIQQRNVHFFSFEIELENDSFKVNRVSPTCGSCTKVRHNRLSKHKYVVVAEFDTTNIAKGSTSKHIIVDYTIDKKKYRSKIQFRGEVI